MIIHQHKAVQQSVAGKPLSIRYIPIDHLTPDPRNARVHSKKQIRQIAKSIESFGFNVPILVDGTSNVVAGHGRLLAAKHLGWTEVPTICLEHLSEAQRRAFMIADNRLTEIAVWNDRLLAEQLKELSDLNLDFDIEVTGFDMGEIDFRIESLTSGSTEVAEPTITVVLGPPVTQVGDIWLLGPHRVMCGNALEDESYSALMREDKAVIIFTDPPYNVPIDGHVSGLGKVQHREFSMARGEMSTEAFTSFLATVFKSMAYHSKPGSINYVCMDWRHIQEVHAAARDIFAHLLNLCIWTKPNAGMGSFYRSQHELVFVFKNGNEPHRNNVELGRHGRNRSNVWPYAGGPGFGRAGEEGRLADLHPTVKPMALVADAILDSSHRGDTVLDPFLGSGTTLMAAERVGRRCYGLELDPLYVDVIVRRWQNYTGQSARNARTGIAFDDSAATTPNAVGGSLHE